MGSRLLERFREVGPRLRSLESSVGPGLLATRSAEGVIVTAQGARWQALEGTDLVAVLDVDPVKGVMLLAGPEEPSGWAAVLALVLRARQDVSAGVFVPSAEKGEAMPESSAHPGGRSPNSDDSETSDASDASNEPGASDNTLASYRVRGWGFEEGETMRTGSASGGLVDWTGWALKRLREGSVAVLPAGHVLAVGRDLDAAAEALVEHCATNDRS